MNERGPDPVRITVCERSEGGGTGDLGISVEEQGIPVPSGVKMRDGRIYARKGLRLPVRTAREGIIPKNEGEFSRNFLSFTPVGRRSYVALFQRRKRRGDGFSIMGVGGHSRSDIRNSSPFSPQGNLPTADHPCEGQTATRHLKKTCKKPEMNEHETLTRTINR